MTLPTIYPVQYNGTASGLVNDFTHVKVDRSGAARIYSEVVSVPTGTTTTTIVGIVPFNKGLRIDPVSMALVFGALGTSVTASLGVVYNDNVGNTNNQTLWVSASGTAAAGGAVVVSASATNVPYVTTGDGWVVVTIGGATTGSTGNVSLSFVGAYDGLGANNSNTQN